MRDEKIEDRERAHEGRLRQVQGEADNGRFESEHNSGAAPAYTVLMLERYA